MTSLATLGALLALTVSWGGCSSAREPRENAGDYASARVRDLVDVVSVRVGVGPGLLIRAQATRWLALGVGSIGPSNSWARYRLEPRFVGWKRREGGTWIEVRREVGISTFYVCEATGERLGGNIESFGVDARADDDFSAEAYALLVGLAVDFSPVEAYDFVAGLFTGDPCGDDLSIDPAGIDPAQDGP